MGKGVAALVTAIFPPPSPPGEALGERTPARNDAAATAEGEQAVADQGQKRVM